MNKSEKLICLLLGAILAWYIFGEMGKARKAAEEAAAIAATNVTETASAPESTANAPATEASAPTIEASAPVIALPEKAEETYYLENDEVKIAVSSWGAAVKSVTLKNYATSCGEVSAENPAVAFDFGDAAIGRGEKLEAYELADATTNSIVFTSGAKKREIVLERDYRIVLKDEGIGGAMSIGAMSIGSSKNDLLSIDSYSLAKNEVIHHGDDEDPGEDASRPIKPYLVAGLSGGCSGSKSFTDADLERPFTHKGARKYVALKNRFFVTALVDSTAANTGFTAKVTRDKDAADYRPATISAFVDFGESTGAKETTFYVGPKKQSALWDLGMKDVMDFGMWRWICYPLVAILNFFNSVIPNYGVAIILLTIFVRLVFWPLTRKSTIGMKKMQEIQPLMKEIQAKFKDNPQRLQQETWALYREHKVNPLSSCLPMLIQIPIFIALFNVLRSAVELRYASFLWIADLSEPEGLFRSWFPIESGLNVLPILMAVTTALQSYFTPSSGDKSQQKMMMVFMPLMMLFMFYSFPAALSLYWFLSNIFSIVQMYLIRRQAQPKKNYRLPDEIIDPPQTRQQRRHG